MSSTLVSSLACFFASLLCAPELHIEVECFEQEQEQEQQQMEGGHRKGCGNCTFH